MNGPYHCPRCGKPVTCWPALCHDGCGFDGRRDSLAGVEQPTAYGILQQESEELRFALAERKIVAAVDGPNLVVHHEQVRALLDYVEGLEHQLDRCPGDVIRVPTKEKDGVGQTFRIEGRTYRLVAEAE